MSRARERAALRRRRFVATYLDIKKDSVVLADVLTLFASEGCTRYHTEDLGGGMLGLKIRGRKRSDGLFFAANGGRHGSALLVDKSGIWLPILWVGEGSVASN